MCAAINSRQAGSRVQTSDSAEIDTQAVFTALEDETCRTILQATADESLTATELIEECGVATSTAYRKLDLLTEAGLVEESLRLRKDGRHANEYRQSFEDLRISIGEASGVAIDVSAPEATAQASD